MNRCINEGGGGRGQNEDIKHQFEIQWKYIKTDFLEDLNVKG